MSDEESSQQPKDEDAKKELTEPEENSCNATNDEAPEAVLDEKDKLEASKGPLAFESLIQNLPAGCSPISCDADDKNLYLGTQQGDLLHYFELEPKNYMLVSQTKFDPNQDVPIEAVRVLPLIEIALVHSGKSLHFYLLPEFAPVPNMGSIANVSDFQIVRYSSSSNSYQVQVFGSEGVRKLNIFNKRVATSDLAYSKPVSRAKVHRKSMMASNGSNYELIDLKTGDKSPLFHVSETGVDLKPMIAAYHTDEFLVCCGSSATDNAMGLVVNCQGDITQGTIVFERYPLDILIDLPFILVDYGELGIYVYQVEMNNEPKIVQKFHTNAEGSRLRLARSTNVFSFDKPERKRQIVDKLRLVPLSLGTHEFRIDQERSYVTNNYEEVTSLLIYSSAGIYLLSKEPIILQISDYSETTIERIKEILQTYQNVNYIGTFQKLNIHYLRLLHLLLITLHCQSIDQKIVSEWCSSASQVDIRVFLRLCDIEILGDPWVPNGLVNFINETRSLKLCNKFLDFLQNLALIREKLREDTSCSVKDRENLFRSIDRAIVKYSVEHELNVNIDQCEPDNYADLLPLLKMKRELYGPLIYDIHLRMGDYPNCLNLLKEQDNGPKISSFMLKHFVDLQSNDKYSQKNLLTDVVFLIEFTASGADREIIMKDVIDIMENAKLDAKDLVTIAERNLTKVTILETLGFSDVSDKHFMIDYYISNVQEVMEKRNLWDLFAQLLASYTQDYDYLKPGFSSYLDLKLSANPECSGLLKYCEKLRALIYAENDRLVFDAVVERIREFDIADVLLFYLICDEDKYLIFEGNLLDKLMTFNDFETIDKLLTQKDVVKVLKFYLSLESEKDSSMLVKNHLRKHLNMVTSFENLVEILKLIPSDYGLANVADALTSVLVKSRSTITDQELHKALLKHQLQASARLLEGLREKPGILE
ncbi:LAME_0F06326g1_1 [Lachancea meyersii CBS 8951]|uniref:LAME_0F06326g1_1 n=1 Tax=Lachancea meyersii CBS 8951 TaxID=1266667 RepID=A0A1G4JTF3_9SACH|nr:LAME_0F06326g1_1 [Lachancea meyersii CBS 8951]